VLRARRKAALAALASSEDRRKIATQILGETAMAYRHLYPCPLDPILFHPDFIALPAAGAGMVFRLRAHAWQTRVRSLCALIGVT
jgi:hypothetical protein